MKSMQTKSKGKKKNGKLGKVKLSTRRDTNSTINPDLSNLRKPIDTSVSALYQVSKLLEDGTDEVKSILSYECDIIYECRVCRSLFRSIINLISHKREYCREKFNSTLHKSVLNNLNMLAATGSVIHMYKTGQTIIKDSIKNDRILRSQVSKEVRKRDLSTIVEMLNKKRENNSLCKSEIESAISDIPSNQHIYLEPIDTNNSAVFQTIKSSDTMIDTTDLIKGQISELQNMMDQNTITLEEHMYENQLEKSDSPIQADISDEENELLIDRLSMNSLVCAICNVKFSTKKTLTCHMKTFHMSQRMCYPCPCCTSTFANTWSVHRHLFKVHRKTNEEVRKLRSHIQEKAFHIETSAMEDLEKGHATRASASENIVRRNSDKAQKWKNRYRSKFDEEHQSCVRCGKKFDGKATLSAHTQYCQTSIAVCNEITTKIKQSNRTLSDSTLSNTLCEVKDTDAVTNKIQKSSANKNTLDINSGRTSSSPEIIDEHHETSIRVQAVSSLSKEDWDMLGNQHNYSPEHNSVDNNNDVDIVASLTTRNINNGESPSSDKKSDQFESNKKSRILDLISTSDINSMVLNTESKKEKMSSHQDEKQLTSLEKRDITEVQHNNSRLQKPSCSIQPSESEQTLLMENKIGNIANLRKLQCLLCKRKFTSVTNLRRHIAIHIGWYRYRCKLCDFKCFVKCDCVAHCNKVHNAQNNRATIADVVIEISQNEYTYNEDIVMDVTSVEKKMDDPDIVDITASSYQSEIHEDVNNSGVTSTYVTLENKSTTTSEQVTESRRDAEHGNIDDNKTTEDSNETKKIQNLAECMNRGSGKLDADPDLKRMIMEVIFGSSDTDTTKQTDSDKIALGTNDDVGRNIDANDDAGSIASTDESGEASCSISDNSKSQRPTRNRIKPLNEDFIYNLKELSSRKDHDLFKEQPLQLGKSLRKNHLHLCDDSDTLTVRKKAKLYN